VPLFGVLSVRSACAVGCCVATLSCASSLLAQVSEEASAAHPLDGTAPRSEGQGAARSEQAPSAEREPAPHATPMPASDSPVLAGPSTPQGEADLAESQAPVERGVGSQVLASPLPAPGAPSEPQAPAREDAPKELDAATRAPADTPWYERLKLRGYTQFRYNRLPSFRANDELINLQGDRTIGGDNGFSIRRARVILYGDLHERVSIYLQSDFASTINDQIHTVLMRDWYTDLFLTKSKSLRIRLGQSKVPYGFENLQSSQNRLALDRSDATNSAVKDERDLGVFLYWAPPEIRERFKHLVAANLKGSGDYGVIALGVYNGQTANKPALSDDMHVVGRVTYPFKFGEQFFEMGAGGYYGKYLVSVQEGYTTPDGRNLVDARGIVSLVLYPQPFGFVAEATMGVGPSMGRPGEPDRDEVRSRKLYGGYAQIMFKIDEPFGTVSLIPFARATYYDGGKKFETNAPHYIVKELELGLEWQLLKALEVVLAYDMADRTAGKAPYRRERGHVTRVQVQVNY
jgi:hypothetical protein